MACTPSLDVCIEYCSVLYGSALYCTARHHVERHCIALHCTVLHSTILHCAALYCIARHYIARRVLHCLAQHYIAQHCTAFYSTILLGAVLHCTAQYCTALYCDTVSMYWNALCRLYFIAMGLTGPRTKNLQSHSVLERLIFSSIRLSPVSVFSPFPSFFSSGGLKDLF